MAWKQDVIRDLLDSGHISKAAIFSLKGDVLAASPGFDISFDERMAVTEGFISPVGLQASGIRVAGKKYFAVGADERSLHGKQGHEGVILVKTNTAVLVGVYVSPTQPGDADKTVQNLAQHLISQDH
ncbi:profilin, required for normal timing of actin polymerization in response to thermal stress [Tilletia horrida]|uniref:Profilin n=1 Tax=Tilletia horrida TaxID=155126 RepID=A0AAN6JSU7_9BASI|nr:profilin, required for normal timing of actin polymerization in response to thermal stress [Tilletia horrida]KAK0553332.1 profilin, required for normal timing of actin polymerization in response to thermal stress [Tilletia horrida]KAK0567717.1 profilin, required for normal timing of actin polymerization in response to thermal stress [Tilletia horrida]